MELLPRYPPLVLFRFPIFRAMKSLVTRHFCQYTIDFVIGSKIVILGGPLVVIRFSESVWGAEKNCC